METHAMAEQSREEESEIDAQNIPSQDAWWKTGKSEITVSKPTSIQLSCG
jgi:hypothetical protein